jgi:hypothetical protein
MIPRVFDPPVITHAVITRILKAGLLYEVRYPNGKTASAHLSKELTAQGAQPTENQRVRLELTPFDFDSARIAEIDPP